MKEAGPILIQNIYYMLSYAFRTLRQEQYEDIATEEFEHVHDLFAAILAKGIGLQLKQGLYREYMHEEENMTTIRGKISMPGTIKNRIAHQHAISCQYDELSENNSLNQILKTTALLLLHHQRVGQKQKAALKRVLLFFSTVDPIDVSLINWSLIRFSRNNDTYRMLIGICRLIIDGMLLTREEGVHRLASFIDEERMHKLFEKFILEYYKQEHPTIQTSSSQIAWDIDDGVTTLLPTMQTDITLTHHDKVLIIEAKYYSRTLQHHFDTHSIHSANLYQIYTYVKNKAATDPERKVSGLLLYAKTSDLIQPDNSYQMGGNTIGVKTLDLNKEFSLIKEQLDAIVQDRFNQNSHTII